MYLPRLSLSRLNLISLVTFRDVLHWSIVEASLEM